MDDCRKYDIAGIIKILAGRNDTPLWRPELQLRRP
jgi:hypothetical protein